MRGSDRCRTDTPNPALTIATMAGALSSSIEGRLLLKWALTKRAAIAPVIVVRS
jgi:hypothetical protein